jgi:coproporphyrinogen III oxidase-like Fe-S oxidoreductase
VHRITVAAAAESNRPLNGKPMSLSEDGMSTITKEINKRFNKATIDIFDDSIEHRPGKCDKKELVKMVSADDWI